MKILIRSISKCILAASLWSAAGGLVFAQAHGTGVFRARLTLPVQMVQPNPAAFDKVIRKTLNNSDIVNLALGRPLTTRVNPKTEVLAAEVTYESHSNAPNSQLIVYDETQNGQAGVVAVVATLQTLDWQNAYERTLNAGFGIGTGTINATTNGTPAQNGFIASAFQGAASCSGRHLFSVGESHATPLARGSVEGHLKFVYTDSKGTHNFDGYIVNGVGTVSGHPIGGW